MTDIGEKIAALADMRMRDLRLEWRRLQRSPAPKGLSRDLLIRAIAWKIQEKAHGGLGRTVERRLRALAEALDTQGDAAFDPGIRLKPGTKLVREWQGDTHSVLVLSDGFEYRRARHRSLSKIAREITGTSWSGPRFFGLKRQPKPFVKLEQETHE